MFNFTRNVSILTAAILILSACNMPSGTPTNEADAIFTQAAWTVEAQLTQAAQFSTPTLPPAPPTSTPTVPTIISPPTQTAAVSATPACDQVQFIRDVTIPDGTTFAPNTPFTKTWRLKNTGVCTWSGYALVFDRGDAMGGVSPVSIASVAPGGEVDVSVSLTAPSTVGSYRGYWRIRNASGVLIGAAFFVDIKVAVTSSGYDLHTRANAATWTSGAGNLTFGGPDTNASGFAIYKDGAKLEDGSTQTKILLTHPQWVDNGFITGLYPAYQVVTGERFKARIGFLAQPDGTCGSGNVKFQLKYREAGVVKSLNEWTKSCNGTLTSVEVELNSLAGKSVEFILTVDANGSSSQDWAVWVAPQVAIP